MSLFITSLNSGSNGNCYYVGNKNEAILVDAGISCRTITNRMKNLHLDISHIRAIFISHEHTDHISGLAVLSHKYQIPVYISKPTLRNSRMKIDPKLLNFFSDDTTLSIGGLNVRVFSKIHDAADPFSFCITDGKVQIGVFTDIGRPDETIVRHFQSCHAAFLEANYDEDMLANGPYPFYLKQRISGGKGHLSNRQAYQLFQNHRAPFLSHLILSHLSAKNNHPEIVEQLFQTDNSRTKIIVASRHKETPVFEIGAGQPISRKAPVYKQLAFNF